MKRVDRDGGKSFMVQMSIRHSISKWACTCTGIIRLYVWRYVMWRLDCLRRERIATAEIVQTVL